VYFYDVRKIFGPEASGLLWTGKRKNKTKSFSFVRRRKRKGFLASALHLAQPLNTILNK
jgi:hypothetical protein